MDVLFRRKRDLAFVAAGLVGFSSAAYGWYTYLTHYCKKPRLYVADGCLKEMLERGVPNLFLPYRPSPWLLNSHLMTVAGVLRRMGSDCYERQLVTMSDGGTVGLDWFADSNEEDRWSPSTPIVLVMHGLTGGSHEGYCRWMCYTAYEHKWRSVVFNYRGCNGVPLTSPKGYSPVVTDDVYTVIDEIKWKYPQAPLFAAAYSLGSLMLCKYLGESDRGRGSRLHGAVMVSNPCCMFTSQNRISKPWTIPWLFNLVLTYRLRSYANEHRDDFGEIETVIAENVKKCRTIKDFEEATVCQLFGFPSLDEYCRRGSSQFHIPHIRTKSLILVAEDDPFIGNMPIKQCLENNNTALAVTSHGGHVAFLQGLWPFGRAWMEDTTMQFFKSCLQTSVA